VWGGVEGWRGKGGRNNLKKYSNLPRIDGFLLAPEARFMLLGRYYIYNIIIIGITTLPLYIILLYVYNVRAILYIIMLNDNLRRTRRCVQVNNKSET